MGGADSYLVPNNLEIRYGNEFWGGGGRWGTGAGDAYRVYCLYMCFCNKGQWRKQAINNKLSLSFYERRKGNLITAEWRVSGLVLRTCLSFAQSMIRIDGPTSLFYLYSWLHIRKLFCFRACHGTIFSYSAVRWGAVPSSVATLDFAKGESVPPAPYVWESQTKIRTAPHRTIKNEIRNESPRSTRKEAYARKPSRALNDGRSTGPRWRFYLQNPTARCNED